MCSVVWVLVLEVKMSIKRELVKSHFGWIFNTGQISSNLLLHRFRQKQIFNQQINITCWQPKNKIANFIPQKPTKSAWPNHTKFHRFQIPWFQENIGKHFTIKQKTQQTIRFLKAFRCFSELNFYYPQNNFTNDKINSNMSFSQPISFAFEPNIIITSFEALPSLNIRKLCYFNWKPCLK
jgi:hypothetical protein